MRLIWQLLAVVAVWILGNLGTAAVKDNPWLALVAGLLTAVVAVLVYGWVVRRTEHRAPVEVSLKGAGAGSAGARCSASRCSGQSSRTSPS